MHLAEAVNFGRGTERLAPQTLQEDADERPHRRVEQALDRTLRTEDFSTRRGAWSLAEQPRSIAVVGCGASGAELVSAYARLGTEMLLFEAIDQTSRDSVRFTYGGRRAS